MFRNLTLITLMLLMAAPSVFADRRKYVWTYQAVTIPQDGAELEFYQTTKLDESDSWEYRIEIEHGITHRLDFAIYQIFAQKEAQSLSWDAVQLRTRYRLADPGEILFDPVLYLEYRRKIDLAKQNKAEAKLLMSYNADKIDFSFNPVYEFFWAPGDPVHEIGLDLGLSYELSYKLSVGLESTSRLEFIDDGDNKKGSYCGPTLSFASGPIWYTFGYAFGVTDDSNDARARFLMGVGL